MEKKSKIFKMAFIGIMSAVICLLGPLSLPVGVVPISLTNLAIYFVLYALGMKKGTVSYIIYMLTGFAGVPVFSGFTGGPAKLLGPTGGYLVGFIFMALIAGAFIDKFIAKRYLCIIGMVFGASICYLFGTVWLSYQADMSIGAAFAAGVFPFIPGDLIKILIAAYLGPKIRNQLIKAKLF
ncbi:biotin transport system substrate-specific component [Ruminiclostridium sufflavum DSM 19573]|uniref:Biotin transporter n=1 Tax=Ruminiclostridium sufflavum DSM 19573 TaxID=1121337 RepID=A0A318XIW2_9FIRM|nr:biotin transporter BioY [Ruminiclostridium sufflavum]PYG85871.1 biotin transport system substrate-specific component [Ruminiclostridium sufflavum DSM 19573]